MMNADTNKNITETEDCNHAHPVTVERRVIRHGSLFSGIGGFDLAAQWTGWENVFQVEIDDYCTKVLERNFPNAKRYRDIRDFDGTQYRGTIDVVSGGFPCQPFSVAGKRKGKEDDRYLWPEMLRVISEARPAWIVGENVAGIVKMALDNVLDDLEALNYETQTFLIPAAGIGANHRRDRIWIVANARSKRGWKENKRGLDIPQNIFQKSERKENTVLASHPCKSGIASNTEGKDDRCSDTKSIDGQIQQLGECTGKGNVSNANSESMANTGRTWTRWTEPCDSDWWSTEPGVGRVANGIPHRMDRLKGLGNAIVPQVAFEIFRAIAAVSV